MLYTDNSPFQFYSDEWFEKNIKVRQVDEQIISFVSPNYEKLQQSLTGKALELLDLPGDYPRLIADVGCGLSVSGEVINNSGNFWVGVDILRSMFFSPYLEHIMRPMDSPNSYVRCDIGEGMPFRPGVYDGAIGIDVLQWLFSVFPGCDPVPKRIRTFFETLHGCLACGARAVFNFHPKSPEQAEMLSTIATKCGFGGGIHIENPNSNAAKEHWLILEVGGVTPDGLDAVLQQNSGCQNVKAFRPRKSGKKGFNRKEWILKKKERQRLLGKKVANDSKYTGRSRRRWF
ncbi:putative 18S rRNA (guanine-N(7))-methyltransferase [Histomonas meleagridis]|uniref:putative 18S rRNA (guanine-N(7))-methyltransferase n=1 Tax=Histomonas meleagridis TaxID=135588 RepID=UPI00355A1230|nr:putative 18S rRNA (guanine-N(7))-methyltransferase [Histomonas meleagridis]KAH0801753.1 putative 18S rRNA (guanine-N(7))-methyltransferase [Histomonas meleagridis]